MPPRGLPAPPRGGRVQRHHPARTTRSCSRTA